MVRLQRVEIYPGISMDPGVRFGKACLAGTRIDVATILGALAAGETFESIQADYQVSRDQILAALSYAAHVTTHQPPAVSVRDVTS